MPVIRPFRALRYEPDTVGDLSLVVSPPYDVILPAQQQVLLARHPKNVVRLDLPTEEPGDEPDARYRRAARTFAAWRSDGTFHKDRRPSVYVHEQTYRVPGSDVERTQRGFFGRLRLEPFGPGSGVLPHEHTLSGPKEDRYKLIRATGANVSPVIGLYDDPSGRSSTLLTGIIARQPEIDVVDDDGTRHRLWVVPDDEPGPDGGETTTAAELVALAGTGPVTIADGHHRYETALRYRDERRMTRSCEEDPAFDYILMLFLEMHQPLTVLPTHRVVRGLGGVSGGGPGGVSGDGFGDEPGDGDTALRSGLSELFDVRPAGRADLERAFGAAGLASGGAGRFGLWTRAGGALLEARPSALEPYLPPGGEALRRLDVTLLQAALERLAGIDAAATAAGRVAYTKSVTEALDWVDAGHDGADAAFLLEPTPVVDIAAVAAAGDVMPQKSTYFHPKALSGLLINPHEW